MRLYIRQKLLLDLVHAAGGELAATDMQKLLFLNVNQCEPQEPSYRFVPYRFGFFSFQSSADRSTLQEKGLISNGITLLCDLMRNPLSRKTGFSKGQLSSYCEKAGIEYRHLPELGIPGHRRLELNTMADYQALLARNPHR